MPLYVADYLADTGHLSTVEHGAYLLLIMHYWQKGGLPDNDRQLSSIARASLEQWHDIRTVLVDLFQPGWRHARIDAELAEADRKYQARANAGKLGGVAKRKGLKQSSSNAKAMLYQPQPQSSTKTEEAKASSSSSEPEKTPAPIAVIGLPTVSEGDVPIFETDVAEWKTAFPGVDVRQQLSAMRSWLFANPTKRKTKRGMRKFIVSWLDRRQNTGPLAPVPRAASPPQQRSVGDVFGELAAGTWQPPGSDPKDERPTITTSFDRGN